MHDRDMQRTKTGTRDLKQDDRDEDDDGKMHVCGGYDGSYRCWRAPWLVIDFAKFNILTDLVKKPFIFPLSLLLLDPIEQDASRRCFQTPLATLFRFDAQRDLRSRECGSQTVKTLRHLGWLNHNVMPSIQRPTISSLMPNILISNHLSLKNNLSVHRMQRPVISLPSISMGNSCNQNKTTSPALRPHDVCDIPWQECTKRAI